MTPVPGFSKILQSLLHLWLLPKVFIYFPLRDRLLGLPGILQSEWKLSDPQNFIFFLHLTPMPGRCHQGLLPTGASHVFLSMPLPFKTLVWWLQFWKLLCPPSPVSNGTFCSFVLQTNPFRFAGLRLWKVNNLCFLGWPLALFFISLVFLSNRVLHSVFTIHSFIEIFSLANFTAL